MDTIEFIITYREPEPFTELGRMHRIEKYNSFTEMLKTTLADEYINNRRFELIHCKHHITILLTNGQKYRFSNYCEYKENIQKFL